MTTDGEAGVQRQRVSGPDDTHDRQNRHQVDSHTEDCIARLVYTLPRRLDWRAD